MWFKEGLKKQREKWRQKQVEMKAKAEHRKKTEKQRKETRQERERELKKIEEQVLHEAYKKESLRLAKVRGKLRARTKARKTTKSFSQRVAGLGERLDSTFGSDFLFGEPTKKKPQATRRKSPPKIIVEVRTAQPKKTRRKRTKPKKKDPLEDFFGF